MSLPVGGEVASTRPAHLAGGTRTFSLEDLLWIAQQFDIAPIDGLMEFVEKGNINLHTFQIHCDGGAVYLLQRINTDVFTHPHRVMSAMLTWLQAQRQYLEDGRAPGWTVWEPITLVETLAGAPYLDLSDETGASVWRLMVKIPESVAYKSLGQILDDGPRTALAMEVGRGLALNSDLTSGVDVDVLESAMPGYRDASVYAGQYRAVLAEVRTLKAAEPYLPHDRLLRESTQNFYLVKTDGHEFQSRVCDPDLAFCRDIVESQWRFGSLFEDALTAGTARKTAIHGDTKLENFLFCKHSGKVRSLVDLDTIMPYTWLADWGDLLRSLVNVAGEKEPDPSKVEVDKTIYAAVAKGFLEASRQVTAAEVNLMVDSVKALTYEIGLRFLTDYFRGDTYFGLNSQDRPDLNKVRAIVQFTLFKRLEECDDWARKMMADTYALVGHGQVQVT